VVCGRTPGHRGENWGAARRGPATSPEPPRPKPAISASPPGRRWRAGDRRLGFPLRAGDMAAALAAGGNQSVSGEARSGGELTGVDDRLSNPRPYLVRSLLLGSEVAGLRTLPP
jgi:hypothetical protein